MTEAPARAEGTGGVERVVIEADGGSRGNPGPAGYGAVVRDAVSDSVLAERSEALGTQTNNVAEYSGLIAGLEAARELGARRVAVRMDSKLVVEQMNGRWQVKNPALRDLARRAVALRQEFEDVSFEWIPREQNRYADRLANEAMDRAAGKVRSGKSAKSPSASGTSSGAAARSGQQDGTAAPGWSMPTGRATRLVLVRHGATEHSAQRRFSGRNALPLDETGREQARALAARHYGEVGAIVSSPLLRAVQTAQLIAAKLDLEVETVDDFVETDFGDWEGLTFEEVRAQDPQGLAAWLASPAAAPHGGESFADVDRRVRRAREAVLAAHPGGHVLVVTHVTPIKALIRMALDAPITAMFRLHLDTASVSGVDYYADGNSSVMLMNDTAHLRQG